MLYILVVYTYIFDLHRNCHYQHASGPVLIKCSLYVLKLQEFLLSLAIDVLIYIFNSNHVNFSVNNYTNNLDD